MEIEISVLKTIKINLEDALKGYQIAWTYDFNSGDWVDFYYLGEKDDVVLEVSQETVGTDGSINLSSLFWLECSDLSKDSNRQEVIEYILKNESRVIDYQKVWEFI